MFTRILALAKKYGSKLTAQHLIADGISESNIPSLLHDIIACNDEANITLLMPLSAEIVDPYYTNKDDLTPIQVAASIKRWDHVLAIVNKPGINHAKARTGYALLQAVIENEALIVDLILEKHTDVTIYRDIEHGYHALHIAIIKNQNPVIVRSLLEAKVDVNIASIHGVTSLAMIMKQPVVNIEILAILCEFNLSIKVECLQYAREGKWSLVNLILNNDKRPHNELKALLLIEAIKQRNEEVLITLYKQGADLAFSVDGHSALSTIINEKSFQYLHHILDNPVLASLYDFSTCLPIVANALQWDLVSKMIPKCKRLDISVNGKTAIHAAVCSDNLEALNKLIRSGAPISQGEATAEVKSPLFDAVSKRSEPLTRMLIEAGALIAPIVKWACNNEKWSDLEYVITYANQSCIAAIDEDLPYQAAYNNQVNLVEALIRRGVKVNSAINKTSSNSRYGAMKILVRALAGNQHHFLTDFILNVIKYSKDPELLVLMFDRGANLYHVIIGNSNAAIYATENNRWDFFEAIIMIPGLDSAKLNIDYCLAIAARESKWILAKKLIEMGANNNRVYTEVNGIRRFPGYYFVASNQLELLKLLLARRQNVQFDDDIWSHAFELAENNNHDAAKLLLLEHGATHQGKILRAANNANTDEKWNIVFDLLKQHYDVSPNPNETEENRNNLIGKLLHIAVDKKCSEQFKTLLLMDPDVTVTYQSKNLLTCIAEHSQWDFLVALQDKIRLFEIKAIESALFQMVRQPDAPFHVITEFLKMVDINITENNTGNSLVHLAIIGNNPKVLEGLLKLGAPRETKNNDKLTPAALLFSLAKEKKLSNAESLSTILTASAEWIHKLELENSDYHREHIQSDSVEKSQELSVTKLKQRYPNVDVNRCINEYKTFVGHLPETTEKEIARKRDALYNLSDEGIQNLVALVWTGANDKTALPYEASHLADDESQLNSYLQLRRESIVEKMCQAKFETKATGSCVRGTRTKVIESLHQCHPDVVICYGNLSLNSTVRDHAVSSFVNIARKEFAALPPLEQRKIAQYINGGSDDLPVFYTHITQKIESELLPTFSALINIDKLNEIIKPEAFTYISFYPFYEIDNLIKRINSLDSVSADESLIELKNIAAAVYDVSKTTSLESELLMLKKNYQSYLTKVSAAQLANNSIFDKVENSNNNNNNNLESASTLNSISH